MSEEHVSHPENPSSELDSLRQQVRDLKATLAEKEEIIRVKRCKLATLNQEREQLSLKVDELTRMNGEANLQKADAQDESGEYRTFCMEAARLLGLDPSAVTTNLNHLRVALRDRIRRSDHEELNAPMVASLRRILDPDSNYATLVQAAQASVSGVASSAITEKDLAEFSKDFLTAIEGVGKNLSTMSNLMQANVQTLRVKLRSGRVKS